jgi:transposase
MNITTNLLNLQALIINNFKESENNITFFVSTLPSPQICPHCGKSTSRIHGYRNQIFKDLSIREKFVSISLKKRRLNLIKTLL